MKFACRGYPNTDGRLPIGELTGTHDHNPLREHSETGDVGELHRLHHDDDNDLDFIEDDEFDFDDDDPGDGV